MRSLLLLTVFVVLFAFPAISHATDTSVGYGFYGPAGDYKIELFETGAPYPSRQDYVYQYRGNATYHRVWNSIVADRYYFIRVTNLQSGVAKQTRESRVTYNGGYYEWGTCNWYTM